MNSQPLFELGSKLIGLYFLVMSVPVLLDLTIGGLLSGLVDQQVSGPPRSYLILRTSGLFFVIILGLALIKTSGFFRRIAFPEREELSDAEIRGLFTVGVKLFGAFLAMREFMSFIKLLSNFITISTLFSGHPNIPESMGIATNFFPSLVSILFGLLLFFRGEMLSRWAFAARRDVENTA